jgi:hypothetical protein
LRLCGGDDRLCRRFSDVPKHRLPDPSANRVRGFKTAFTLRLGIRG